MGGLRPLPAERAVGPGGRRSALPLVGGKLPATDETVAAANRLRAALDDLVGGAHRAGALRADFASADIPLLLEHLSTRIPVADERAATLHLRYLDLVLAGLRTSAPDAARRLAEPGSGLGGTQRAVERSEGWSPALP